MRPASDAGQAETRTGCSLELLEHGPGTPALRAPEDADALSYGRLAAVVDELADRLAALGVERGDRVGLALAPGPEFVELLLAIAALGAAAAPLNPAYSTAEFAFYLEDLQPRALLVPLGELDAARQAAQSGTALVDVTLSPGSAPELAVPGHGRQQPSERRRRPTTWRSSCTRAARRAGRSRFRCATATSWPRPGRSHAITRSPPTTSRTARCRSSTCTVSSPRRSRSSRSGGTVLAPRRVAPGRFWSQLAEHGATWYSASPTLHQMVLERAPERRADGVRLRFARSCSSAMAPELAARIEAYVDAPLLEAYGMTEASHEMAANPLPPRRRVLGSVGVPTGAEIRDRRRARPRRPGGRGRDPRAGRDVGLPRERPGQRRGVHRTVGSGPATRAASTTTATSCSSGGSRRSSSAAARTSRRSRSRPCCCNTRSVSEAVAYGVPDAKYGQLVGVAVVPAGDLSEADVVAHCKEHLASFKAPSVVHIVDSIPRTPTGKVQRPRMPAHFGED